MLSNQEVVKEAVPHLRTYRPEQQHNGMYLSGFDWRLYGTGTFRKMPKDEEQAVFLLNRYANKLSRAMQYKKHELAYYAALEERTPGLGGKPIRRHWHFLIACPDHQLLPSVAEQLWLENGICKIDRYDSSRAAGYYINKLVSEGAVPYERNMEALHYAGPSDLIAATVDHPFVPERLKGMSRGEYLTVWHPEEPNARL